MEIKHKLTNTERQLIYRLRYEVYVKELGYRQQHACHDKKLLPDIFDRSGDPFAAFKDGIAIGTCLSNYTINNDLGYYPSLYKMKALALDYEKCSSISTKLIVHKDYRKSPVAFKLALATYIKGLKDGIKYNFVDCEPGMIGFFRKLGYVVHLPEVSHP
ncbi:MAG TPA: hypothetical protein VIC08_05955, partial [Cellvibrionaceae bacterium]